jgi:glycosyltransferase involved in cell wall biosynthesis
MSEDGTRNIVESYQAQHHFISLLDNPERITPTALNIGLNQAKSDIIMRMDAHTLYPPNYISGLVAALRETGGDNVGGRWITQPGADTPVAKAIALVLAHPLGVGNAYFRIGAKEARRVDTVPFGCYRREVFERLGRFDERLERNQDIEFNARLQRAGGTIYLIPVIYSLYHARSNLRDLWWNNFGNGCWNIYSTSINSASLSWRHFVPLLFVSTLLLAAGLVAIFPAGWHWLGLILGGYVLTILGASVSIAKREGMRQVAMLPLVFAVLHFSYGLGSVWGLITVIPWRRVSRPSN